VRAHHFADYYMIQGFANRILDLFINTLVAKLTINADTLATIYENTPASSMLRKVLAESLFETSDMFVDVASD
jgi:hypothetical protein